MDDVLKTRGIIYLNVQTWLLVSSPIKISGYASGCDVHEVSDPSFLQRI